ncbi:hypothetical protein GCM10007937_31590 [Mesorhizobium albiziae]|nr:hypothetical protein GCM10007937_31590 [Mesorhizobium albiziae]
MDFYRVLGAAEHAAMTVEDARARAAGPDIDGADQIRRQEAFASARATRGANLTFDFCRKENSISNVKFKAPLVSNR